MNGKFRAWDNENNKYFEPIYNACYGELEDLIFHLDGRLALRTMEGILDQSMFPDRFAIEHYTGLNDKNGKKIYEGDIVYGCWYSSEEPIDDTTGTVMYFEGWCAFVIWDEENKMHSELNGQGAYIHTFEVIGNIHENPELLKGGTE